METFKKIEIVREVVKDYYDKNGKYCGIPALDKKTETTIDPKVASK